MFRVHGTGGHRPSWRTQESFQEEVIPKLNYDDQLDFLGKKRRKNISSRKAQVRRLAYETVIYSRIWQNQSVR